MKAKVSIELSYDQVAKALPAKMKAHLASIPREDGSYAMIGFPLGDSSLVVTSKALDKALSKVPDYQHQDIKLIIFGENFTEEAEGCAEAAKAILLRLSDWHWTDSSIQQIRQKIGG